MSKLAMALLVVPTLLMVGSPSKVLKINQEHQAEMPVSASSSHFAALPDQAETPAPQYEVSLSARAHAASHRTISPQVIAMVSAF